MLISHSSGKKKIEKEVSEEVGFCITNKKGGFFNLGVSSRYRGVFFKFDDEVIKVIDDIRCKGKANELRNNFWNIVRCKDNACESFFMPFGTDSLVCELSNEDDIEILFDVKKAYDNRVWGRNYKVSEEGSKVIIEFTKETDSKEDSTTGQKEFSVFIAISYSGKVNILDEWEEQDYVLDKERNSHPTNRFVYKGLKINTKRIIIGVSHDKLQAIKICDNISNHLDKFKKIQKQYSMVSVRDIKDDRINLAVKCAIESLDALVVNQDYVSNIYAGLPWFFQFWSRDTLISIKALILDKEYDLVKRILMEYLHKIDDDGLLPNINDGSAIKSADSIGWYFKRWGDFIEILRKEGQLKNYFKKSEILYIISRLEDAINKIFRNYTIDSMAKNESQETWMDTLYNGDGRSGIRIEIQALRMAMYELMFKLTDNKIYDDMAKKLENKVKESFFTGDSLKDGISDSTIRPNIFIAAYIYPYFLSNEEWIKCFDKALSKLWLEWGGISTIDKSSKDFYENNTGEDSSSYHRGDSWYWINNLAALAMYRVDKTRFKKYIDKIIEASSEDILFKGFIGCHSEISSAGKQEAKGCFNQAWSNAFFVELIEEINSKD